MPNTILLDPTASTPAVIEIDDVCYKFSKPCSAPPNLTSPDATFSDCQSCLCDCDLAASSFTGSFSAITWCNICTDQTNGPSSLSFSGSGSTDGTFTSNLPDGLPIRDPAYTCTDPDGYAWGATCTVTCNSDGEWSATLGLVDGCGTVFSAPGTGTLTCTGGVLTGTVTASGDDNHGNPVTVTFTFS